MCKGCVEKFKHIHLSSKTKAKTYGQVKALAQSFHKYKIVGMYDHVTNVGIEAHLHKIERAKTKICYKRNKRIDME